MRRVKLGVSLFAATALVGPLLRLATWPPSRFEQKAIFDFIYVLVLLLWPTQPMAAVEVTVGRAMAGVYSIGANLVLFSMLGLVVSLFCQRRGTVWLAYAMTCGVITLQALWGAGFSLEYLNWLALGAALVVYAIPFLLLGRWHQHEG